jgi:uncharacterized RDD family membrane protein YckC
MDDARESLLETRLAIETPERIAIVHDVAGIGSRFAAGTIDMAILSIPLCIASCAVTIVGGLGEGKLSNEEIATVVLAVTGVVNAIVWSYYLLSEAISGGKTVGKHFLRLRVVSLHGGPAPVGALLVRNVLRVLDMLPFAHLLGGVVMFCNARSRRIGDLAAGTIVVRERPLDDAGGGALATPGGLSAAESSLVRTFLARRAELRPDIRAARATDLVAKLRARHPLPAESPDVAAEHLLVLLGQGHAPDRLQELLAGPAPSPAPPASAGPPPAGGPSLDGGTP